MADTEQPDYTHLTVQLLSAYVANNSVASEDLAALIQSTRAALVAETASPPVETVEYVPAVSVRKSIASREHILSLIDGRPYKTLKRHLATHGLTPSDYRARYGLPETYPMVAQAYSDQRRAVAQKLGLGQRGTQARLAAAEAAGTSPAPASKAKAAKSAAALRKAEEAPAPAAKAAGKGKGAPATKNARKANAASSGSVTDAPVEVETAKAKKAPARSAAPRKKLGVKVNEAV